MVILAVLGGALVSAALVGALAWRLPNFDPGAPRADGPVQHEVEAHPQAASFLRRRLDPGAITGFGLTIALVMIVVGAVAIGSLLIMVRHNAGLARYDLTLARWGGSHATTGSTHFLRALSQLGGTPVMIGVAALAALVEYGRTRTRAVWAFMTVVVAGQVTIMNITKVIVNRARPDIHRLTGFSGSSFPSGHSATAAATFAAVALLVGRRRSQQAKALLAATAAGIAVAVAITRVLLGVHWMTDVIAGLAMGWAWFAFSSIAFGGRVLSFGKPVVLAEAIADEVERPLGAGAQPAGTRHL
jgi:membrane-associated phospholipid phosphatase